MTDLATDLTATDLLLSEADVSVTGSLDFSAVSRDLVVSDGQSPLSFVFVSTETNEKIIKQKTQKHSSSL